MAVRSAVAAPQRDRGSGSRSGARHCEMMQHEACVSTRRKMRDGPTKQHSLLPAPTYAVAKSSQKEEALTWRRQCAVVMDTSSITSKPVFDFTGSSCEPKTLPGYSAHDHDNVIAQDWRRHSSRWVTMIRVHTILLARSGHRCIQTLSQRRGFTYFKKNKLFIIYMTKKTEHCFMSWSTTESTERLARRLGYFHWSGDNARLA